MWLCPGLFYVENNNFSRGFFYEQYMRFQSLISNNLLTHILHKGFCIVTLLNDVNRICYGVYILNFCFYIVR